MLSNRTANRGLMSSIVKLPSSEQGPTINMHTHGSLVAIKLTFFSVTWRNTDQHCHHCQTMPGSSATFTLNSSYISSSSSSTTELSALIFTAPWVFWITASTSSFPQVSPTYHLCSWSTTANTDHRAAECWKHGRKIAVSFKDKLRSPFPVLLASG